MDISTNKETTIYSLTMAYRGEGGITVLEHLPKVQECIYLGYDA